MKNRPKGDFSHVGLAIYTNKIYYLHSLQKPQLLGVISMAERQQTREEFKAELAKAVDSMEETVAMLIKTGQMLSSINERYHQGEGPVRDVRLVEEEDDGFKVRFTLVNRALMNVSDLGCGFESDKVWTAEKIALRILDFAYRIWTS